MSYRPYPNRERALAQIARAAVIPPPTEFQLRMAEQANAALAAAARTMRPFVEAFRRPA